MKLMSAINKYYMYHFFIFELKSKYISKVEKILIWSDACICVYLNKLQALVLYKCINHKKNWYSNLVPSLLTITMNYILAMTLYVNHSFSFLLNIFLWNCDLQTLITNEVNYIYSFDTVNMGILQYHVFMSRKERKFY